MGSHRAPGPVPRRTPSRSVSVGASPRRAFRAGQATTPVRRLHRAVPKVGVVAVLTATTIVAPVLGLGAVDAPRTADASAAVAGASLSPVPRAAQPLVTTPTVSTSFSVLPAGEGEVEPAEPPASMVPIVADVLSAQELAAIRTQAEEASRAQQRAALPGCDGEVPVDDAANGQLDTGALCEIWVEGRLLRADAALALARLNAAFATAHGEDLCVTDAYRSYAEQVSVRGRKPGLAAVPGTSEHGWGLAVDLCDGEANSGSARSDWMRENAPAFGWDNPDWARSGGSGPFEPWHWEFVAGQVQEQS